MKETLGSWPLRRVACVVCGALAIFFCLVSLQRMGWTLDRVFHEFWVGMALIGLMSGSLAIGCTISDFWRARPRKKDWAAFMATAFGSTVVLALTATHDDVDLGSLPAWVSAGGALFTAGGVLVALRSYQATRRTALEDQANQVRLLQVQVMPDGSDSHGKRQWRTVLTNRSKDPLYGLEVRGFRAQVEDDAAPVNMSAFEETTLLGPNAPQHIDQLHPEPAVRLGALQYCPVLEAGAQFTLRWASRRAVEPNPPTPAFVNIWYSVTDANGRFWNVVDNNEPEKVSRPTRRLG